MAIRASDWGPFGEPALVVVYGDSSTGKTFDALRSMPTALFLGPPGAFKPSVVQLGFTAQTIQVTNLYQALEVLAKAVGENASLPIEKRRSSIVLDEFTILADTTLMLMEDSGKYVNRRGASDVWAIYGELRRLILRFCYYARNAGMHVMILGHESDPFIEDEPDPATGRPKKWKGGLKVGSKAQTKAFPFFGDEVYRARSGGTAAGLAAHYWRGYFECVPGHDDYFQKTRVGTASTVGPMNTGEILRLGGYRLERLAGLEWMDDQVAIVAQALSADGAEVKSPEFDQHRREWTVKLLNGKLPLFAAQWVMQDAVDRVDIVRRKRSEQLAMLGVSNGAPGSYAVATAPAPAAGTLPGSVGGAFVGGKL